MKRLPWIIAAVVVLVVLVAVLWWRRMSPAGVATPPSSAAAAVARSQLRLSLQIEVADPGVEALATVKVFDPQAVQREAFQAAETANGREVRNSARARVMNAPPATAPDGWERQLSFTRTMAETSTSIDARVVRRTADGAALLTFVAPPAGARVSVSMPWNGTTVTSNAVAVVASATPLASWIARGRIAEQTKNADGLTAAAAAISAANAREAWGPYFQGAALELSGDRAGARTAYARALALSPKGQEPPVTLLEKLRLLR